MRQNVSQSQLPTGDVKSWAGGGGRDWGRGDEGWVGTGKHMVKMQIEKDIY